jgi:uncharacterized membrane protein
VPESANNHASVSPIAQNIETIAEIHARAEEQISRHQRAVEMATNALGRPGFLYAVLAAAAAWALANLLMIRLGKEPLDEPPFFWMQGAVGLAALTMTIMVLITQNRQARRAERRAHLELQVNLLAEQKVTKLVALVEELRRDLPIVRDRDDPEADAMAEAADPHAVLEAIDETLSDPAGITVHSHDGVR